MYSERATLNVSRYSYLKRVSLSKSLDTEKPISGVANKRTIPTVDIEAAIFVIHEISSSLVLALGRKYVIAAGNPRVSMLVRNVVTTIHCLYNP
jgi:hypothetical protein